MLRTHITGTEALLGLGKSRTLFRPTPRLALALARCRAHFSKDVHKNGLFVGRKPRCVGHLAGEVAYKQEEQQDHSGRTTPTDGGQRSPSWQMQGHLVVWVRWEPRKAGLVKPPRPCQGQLKDVLLQGHQEGRMAGHAWAPWWQCLRRLAPQQQQPGPNRAPRQNTILSPRAWAPTGAPSALLGRGPRVHRKQALQGSPPLAPAPAALPSAGGYSPFGFLRGVGR